MADMSEPTAEEVTAYHEAGHAVAALALGRPVRSVSIRPDSLRLGNCAFGTGSLRASADELEREALIALGGIAAELLWRGHYDAIGGAHDLRAVARLTLERAGGRRAERLERRLLTKAQHLLGDDANWRAVERLAAELLARQIVSGRAARHIWDECQE